MRVLSFSLMFMGLSVKIFITVVGMEKEIRKNIRGGGDSRFGMIVDSIFMWLVAVPLTFLAAYVFKLPPIWVYFVMSLDELEKMPVVFIHYFRRKWLTNITRDFD